MLVMDVNTWDAKDYREVVKRFSTWPGAPEGDKIVGAWIDVTRRKSFFLHDVTDVKAAARVAFDWADLITMEEHIVLLPEETMAIAKEKGWW